MRRHGTLPVKILLLGSSLVAELGQPGPVGAGGGERNAAFLHVLSLVSAAGTPGTAVLLRWCGFDGMRTGTKLHVS